MTEMSKEQRRIQELETQVTILTSDVTILKAELGLKKDDPAIHKDSTSVQFGNPLKVLRNGEWIELHKLEYGADERIPFMVAHLLLEAVKQLNEELDKLNGTEAE